MDDLDDIIGTDDRDEALRRGFSQHDTLTFMGKRLRPMTAGTLDLLQKTGNRLLAGGQETPFSDIAGFALLHIADEDQHKAVRAQVWKGRSAWNEYVYQFLNDTPNVEVELRDASPAFRKIIADYTSVITRPANAMDGKKKYGHQDGSLGLSLP
jgi:hypothetical protein